MKILATTALLALGSIGAEAASVLKPGEVATAPILTGPSATIDYIDFFGDGDLSAFDIALDGTTDTLSFGLAWNSADPSDATGYAGGFAVDGTSGRYLDGEMSDVGYVGDILEFRFENLNGAGAASFGPAVLLSLDIGIALPNGLMSLSDGDIYNGRATLNRIAAVPLPATLPLFGVALAGLAFGRRRHV